MGSGKTTVGRLLAQRFGWDFADLDDHVAAREGSGVPSLIADRGETAFRALEAETLGALLLRSPLVIALGGGAPETPSVQTMLREALDTLVVHLEAPFDLLYGRCLAQAQDVSATARPLLGERSSTAARYQRRAALYQGVAHLTVNAGSGAPEQIAETIFLLVQGQVERLQHSQV